jgi:hypothetical protein
LITRPSQQQHTQDDNAVRSHRCREEHSTSVSLSQLTVILLMETSQAQQGKVKLAQQVDQQPPGCSK